MRTDEREEKVRETRDHVLQLVGWEQGPRKPRERQKGIDVTRI